MAERLVFRDAAGRALTDRDLEGYAGRVRWEAPRGYFTCKTSLDLLRRERDGELFPGFAQAYTATEWMEPGQKRRLLAGLAEKFPGASLFAGRGDRDAAITILGELALSPRSTLATEHMAKAMLARLIAQA